MTPGRKPSSRTSARAHQRPDDVEVGGVLEVERDRALAAVQQRRRPEGADQPAAAPAPVDADDVGAQVGQQHAAERPRPQPGELDDPYALRAVPLPSPPLPAGRRRATLLRACCPTPAPRADREVGADGLPAGGARRRAGCAGPLGRRRGAPLRPRRLAVGDAAGQPHRLPAARRPARRARRPLPRAPPGRGRSSPSASSAATRPTPRSPSRSCSWRTPGAVAPPAGYVARCSRRRRRRRPWPRARSAAHAVLGRRRVTPLLVVAGALVGAPLRLLADPARRRAAAGPGASGTAGGQRRRQRACSGALLGLADVAGLGRGPGRHRLLRHAHHLLDVRRRRRPAGRGARRSAGRWPTSPATLVLGLGAAAAGYVGARGRLVVRHRTFPFRRRRPM